MSQEDRAFIKKFSGIIVGLMIFTILIIALAMSMQSEPDPDANPSQLANAKERIAPVGAVRTGAEGAAQLAAAEAATPAPAPDSAPAGEPAAESSGIDGAKVYNGLCQSCHEFGVAGAPKRGSDDMVARAEANGMDGMVTNAINGMGMMPPKGGMASLSDEEVRAAVEYMMEP